MTKTFFQSNYFWAITGGFVMYLSWYPNSLWPLAFVGLIPLFLIEDKLHQNNSTSINFSFWKFSFIFSISWNFSTTWWIGYASIGGATLAIVLNSMMQASVIFLYHVARVFSNQFLALLFFIFAWLGFEFLHLNWDMSWPWLNLGNVFCNATQFIQWYEYTGVAGGSLLVLSINIVLYFGITRAHIRKKATLLAIGILICLQGISFYLTKSLSSPHGKEKVEVVLAQPNADPYNEKFSGEGNMLQIEKLLTTVKEQLTPKTSLLIGPETAIPINLWEKDIDSTTEIRYLRSIINNSSSFSILLGASTCRLYAKKATSTSRELANTGSYYDSYNSAFFVEKGKPLRIYHKSKLVPGVEIIPFPSVMKYFEKYAIDLGGTIGSLGTQSERTVFKTSDLKLKVAQSYVMKAFMENSLVNM